MDPRPPKLTLRSQGDTGCPPSKRISPPPGSFAQLTAVPFVPNVRDDPLSDMMDALVSSANVLTAPSAELNNKRKREADDGLGSS